MNGDTMNYVVRKTKELTEIPNCRSELKKAAQDWLDAVGTDREGQMAKIYVASMEENLMPIDGLIFFAESEAGKGVFGDRAAGVAAHARQIKEEGAKYCDCPACKAVAEILEKKECILGM